MTIARRHIFTASVLLGVATGAGTALTTRIGLGSIDAWIDLILSALVGLVSGTTTAIATASALIELISPHSTSESPGNERSSDNTCPDLPDISNRQPKPGGGRP
jgi:hypothetical protein